jgi:hypothetical protein
MKIRIIDTIHWKGFYIDGKLIMEGIDFNIYDILNALIPNEEIKTVRLKDLNIYEGVCPSEWSELLEKIAR